MPTEPFKTHSKTALKNEIGILNHVDGIGINGGIAADEAQRLIDKGISPLNTLIYMINANVNSIDILAPVYSDTIVI